MGILDKLKTDGSDLSYHDGKDPSINELATDDSLLHASKDGKPGYSLDGAGENIVRISYAMYEDGANNPLPQPSKLDLARDKRKTYTNPETGASYNKF